MILSTTRTGVQSRGRRLKERGNGAATSTKEVRTTGTAATPLTKWRTLKWPMATALARSRFGSQS
jgi:hypothetical protein